MTIDQLRALEALEQEKSFHRAAVALRKSYGALNHLIRTLEEGLELKLVDRSGYRSRLTAEGRAVLMHGAKVQRGYEDFLGFCRTLKSGWEPRVQIVADGVFNQRAIVSSIRALRETGVSTQVEAFESHLEEVEDEFFRRNADLMILLSPIRNGGLPSVALKPVRIALVCARTHPLAGGSKWGVDELRARDFVAIRGSKGVLGLSTSELERRPMFTVGDFHAKREFIAAGLAFGWLPEEMIAKELRSGAFKKIPSEIANAHTLRPRLYHRPRESLGKAALKLIDLLKASVG